MDEREEIIEEGGQFFAERIFLNSVDLKAGEPLKDRFSDSGLYASPYFPPFPPA